MGSYSCIKQHLLGIGVRGVNACDKLKMFERSELLRLEMGADAKGALCSQNVTLCEGQNVEKSSKRKENKTTNIGNINMPSPYFPGTSS